MTSPALTALVADAEELGSAWLHLLTTATEDGDLDEHTRRQLNAAANHAACALNRLARIQTPVRRTPTTAPSGGLASTPARQLSARESRSPSMAQRPAVTSGGPVQPPSDSEGGRAGATVRPACPGAVQSSVAAEKQYLRRPARADAVGGAAAATARAGGGTDASGPVGRFGLPPMPAVPSFDNGELVAGVATYRGAS